MLEGKYRVCTVTGKLTNNYNTCMHTKLSTRNRTSCTHYIWIMSSMIMQVWGYKQWLTVVTACQLNAETSVSREPHCDGPWLQPTDEVLHYVHLLC